MTIDPSVLIGIACTILGAVLGILGWRRNSNKDLRTAAEDNGELRSDIKYIKGGIEDIKVDMRVRDKEIGVLTERVTRVEESTKQAHLRINEIKE